MSDTPNSPPPSDLPPPSSGGIEGERHVSEVAGRAPIISKRAGVGVIIAGAAIACGVILLTSAKPDLKPDPGPPLTARPAVTFVPPPCRRSHRFPNCRRPCRRSPCSRNRPQRQRLGRRPACWSTRQEWAAPADGLPSPAPVSCRPTPTGLARQAHRAVLGRLSALRA